MTVNETTDVMGALGNMKPGSDTGTTVSETGETVTVKLLPAGFNQPVRLEYVEVQFLVDFWARIEGKRLASNHILRTVGSALAPDESGFAGERLKVFAAMFGEKEVSDAVTYHKELELWLVMKPRKGDAKCEGDEE